MGNEWVRSAVKLNPSPGHESGLQMDGGEPRAVLHRTAGGSFSSNASFLAQEKFEVQILWDPNTGEIGQYFPLSRGGYGLQHHGVATNAHGKVCIQIEVVDHGKAWSITDTPMLGLEHILEATRSWGIPDVWPLGPPSPLSGPRAGGDATIWLNHAGWYGHCHVPGNTHVDPGTIDVDKFFGHSPHINLSEEFVMRPEDEQLFKKWVADVVDSRVAIILHGIAHDPTHQYGLEQIKAAVDKLSPKT